MDGSSDSEQSESDSESATNTAVTGASSLSRGGKRYFTGWQKTFKKPEGTLERKYFNFKLIPPLSGFSEQQSTLYYKLTSIPLVD